MKDNPLFKSPIENMHLRYNSSAQDGKIGNGTRCAMGIHTGRVKCNMPWLENNATYTISFMTSYITICIPSDGIVEIEFPSGLDISGVINASSTSLDGIFTVTIISQKAIVARNGDGTAYLYICIINQGLSLTEWRDFIAIDITRDPKGAISILGEFLEGYYMFPDGPIRTCSYNRKPEYLIISEHNDGGAAGGTDWIADGLHDNCSMYTNLGNGWGLYKTLTDTADICHDSGNGNGDNYFAVRIPWTDFKIGPGTSS